MLALRLGLLLVTESTRGGDSKGATSPDCKTGMENGLEVRENAPESVEEEEEEDVDDDDVDDEEDEEEGTRFIVEKEHEEGTRRGEAEIVEETEE